MRTFIAIPLPDEIKNYLFLLQKKLRLLLPAKVHWVAKKHLHLTLKFFGELTDKEVAAVRQSLSQITFQQFTLTLYSFGVFPSDQYVRVLWVGVTPLDSLRSLQQDVDASTISFGKQEQEFKWHITLGRVKLVKDKESFAAQLKEVAIDQLSFAVNSFQLMQSVLSKDGPSYVVVEQFSLF